MTEDKDRLKPFSTCLEGSPCAEMMQKIMGEQGIGSLCEEMMRSFMKTGRKGQRETQAADTQQGPEEKKDTEG